MFEAIVSATCNLLDDKLKDDNTPDKNIMNSSVAEIMKDQEEELERMELIAMEEARLAKEQFIEELKNREIIRYPVSEVVIRDRRGMPISVRTRYRYVY